MTILRSSGPPPPPPIAGRGGSSPIGTTSPNSGSMANTNSAYAPGAFTSGVNVQGSATAYTIQNTDYQGLVLFNTSSALTVTLHYALGENFATTILNIGSGKITLLPDIPPADSGSTLYTVNGSSSLTLPSGAGCIVAFAQRLWYAYVGATFIPVVPATFTPITNEWLRGYSAVTGIFSASQPDFTNITGNLTTSQLPVAGLTTTLALAKLTGGGTDGSATIQNGIVTAYTPPT